MFLDEYYDRNINKYSKNSDKVIEKYYTPYEINARKLGELIERKKLKNEVLKSFISQVKGIAISSIYYSMSRYSLFYAKYVSYILETGMNSKQYSRILELLRLQITISKALKKEASMPYEKEDLYDFCLKLNGHYKKFLEYERLINNYIKDKNINIEGLKLLNTSMFDSREEDYISVVEGAKCFQ